MNIHQDFNSTFDATAKVENINYELKNTHVNNLTDKVEKLILAHKRAYPNITNEEIANKVTNFINSLFKESNL